MTDYVQVPRAATSEMMQAGLEAMRTENVRDTSENGRCARIYVAMLDAAPQVTDAKPVGWLVDEGFMVTDPKDKYAVTLYAKPPAPDATNWKAQDASDLVRRLREDGSSWAQGMFNEAADAITAAQAENEKLREALKPFADYADPSRRISPHLILTKGSALARRQLTMGDCYAALAALSPPPLSPEKP